jgi:cadmium resistance protein CadD (predicted permease)
MMADALQTLGVGVLVFASTNLDDIFLLVAFFSDGERRSSHVIAGQFLGIAVLILASVAGALLSLVIPEAWIGLLGLAPLFLGLQRLAELRRPGGGAGEDEDEAAPRGGRWAGSEVL